MTIRLRDPVHNFIELRADEVNLLDTQALQRLRGIKQLAMAQLVYPGAVHTRFEHSLGVMHLAGLMANELGCNEDEIRLVRLAALLHDIGHGPFSHISERALEIFYNPTLSVADRKGGLHELISATIVERDGEILRRLGKDTCTNIAKLLRIGYGQPALKSIVRGPLDADKQDYLLRDSLFCGVKYGVFDIHQMHRSLILHGPEDEKELMIRQDGIHAVEQYVLAKYYLTTNVYRHKVRLITDQMMVRAISLGIEKDEIEDLKRLYHFDGSDDFIQYYERFDDAAFMQKFCLDAAEGSKCKEVLLRVRQRKLLKRVFDCRVREFKDSVRDMLPKLMDEQRDLRKRVEAAIAREIEERTGKKLDADLVVVNVFSIRSAREMSRNDEQGILVLGDPPELFENASTLFASINERYADEFVEVYAPIEWSTEAEKNSVRRKVKQPIFEVIETNCAAAIERPER